ncbi:MAG: Gfo/Idh/MocA family oxidoreductase [Patescibacteria group bacterium]
MITTKLIIIGFGSIGQRHYKNLLSLGYENVYVYDVDPKKIQDSRFKIQDLDEKTLKDFNVAFITNPTHLHVETALLAAKAGCHLFIEKPLSHNLKGIKNLIEVAKKKKSIVMVGCNYRFNKGFKMLEEVVKNKKFGDPLLSRVVISQNLIKSRPGVDFKTTYAAQSKFGGGVILDSGSHAVDYLSSLFGFGKCVSAYSEKNDKLDIDAEHSANFILKHKNGVVSEVSLDYFGEPKKHSLEVQFKNGSVKWNFAGNTIETYDSKSGESKITSIYGASEIESARNDMYVEELRHFLNAVKYSGPVINDLENAFEVMKILIKAKK